MAKERNSIVELFWLISMWCVFAHHFVIHNADDISVFASPLTRLIFKGVFLPIGKVAVGCFVFIAVWFIADRASFSIKDAVKKLIILNNEVVFYSITLGIISIFTGSLPLSASFFINTVFPIATGYGWRFNTSAAGLISFSIIIVCIWIISIFAVRFVSSRRNAHRSHRSRNWCLLFTITVNFNTTSWNKLALVGTACFISGLLLLYLPYHSQGIIHDFAVNLFNGYVYSSASILSMGLSFAVFLSVFKLCLKY